MEDEYIIINKTAIQKRIKELINNNPMGINTPSVVALKQVLTQSTHLIPEIEKAFDNGCKYGDSNCETDGNSKLPNKLDYISNLKLDI